MNLDCLNSGEMRFSAGAVNVEGGNYLDNYSVAHPGCVKISQ